MVYQQPNRIARFLQPPVVPYWFGAAIGSAPPAVPTGNALTSPTTPVAPAVGQTVQCTLALKNNSAWAVTVSSVVANIVNPSTGLVLGYFNQSTAYPVTIQPGAIANLAMATTAVQARQTLPNQPATLDAVWEITVDGVTYVFGQAGFMTTPLGVPSVTVTQTTYTAV